MAECRGKKKFDTVSEADKAKIRIWGKDPNCDFNDLHSYKCDICGYFHVGHKSYYEKKMERLNGKTDYARTESKKRGLHSK